MSVGRVLYAPNIHQGGGKTLLLPLIEGLRHEPDVMFVLDQRLQLPSGMELAGRIIRVKPTLFSRFVFEWNLRRLFDDNVRILCMGNLPPLFAHQGEQIVFIQNRYLIESIPLAQFPLPIRMRIRLERWWLHSRARYVQVFIVQTRTMRHLINQALKMDAMVLPFKAVKEQEKPRPDGSRQYDFLYVATGEPHKNHRVLIDAWAILARSGLFPSLCLTLDARRFPQLCDWIADQVEKYALNIFMMGECTTQAIDELYQVSGALIYPSLLESFGLPLIEAVQAGLPVLAGSRDYVCDVIQPTATFDPLVPDSISNAVANFSFAPARLNIELFTPDNFLARTLCPEPSS